MFKKWSAALVLGVATASFGITASAEESNTLLEDAFLGTWTFQTGSQVTSPCLSSAFDLTGKAGEVTAGSAAGEIVVTVQGCKIPFVETDATHAKLKQRTQCELSDGSTTYNVDVTGANASIDASGVLHADATGTANIFCSIKLTGTATK
ncbi:hypothetical protein LVJ94_50865 [Pendulispora rubella]|uniref:Uncharacterized protein n=1 Tax=Pendulispora rubella TaxID=2741070 RepID=A0ABZ2L8Y1_9BACT